MTLIEQVYAQAATLAGTVESEQQELLTLFCRSAVNGMLRRLREGLTQDDCKADLIAAGALYALAALEESDPNTDLERVAFGDVTLVKGGKGVAPRCLRRQADMIFSPYCADTFVFRGV